MVDANSLIKASAGTGKTFALATRFIRQMLIDKVDPKTIVALTFSRAAAQEIYAKILMRLCAAAADRKGADDEWATLLEDFRKGPFPSLGRKRDDRASGKGRVPCRDVWKADGKREIVERCSPSKISHGRGKSSQRMKTAGLFAPGQGMAARHGLDVHAAYQKIEWTDGAAAATLPAAFRDAFAKPSNEATVWRERSYELVDGNRWETGQFDRVVFTGTGGSRRATIYDFKTNAKTDGESDEDFASRMVGLHAPQMAAYRWALSRLTGIPIDRIETQLLLEDTGQAVRVG